MPGKPDSNSTEVAREGSERSRSSISDIIDLYRDRRQTADADTFRDLDLPPIRQPEHSQSEHSPSKYRIALGPSAQLPLKDDSFLDPRPAPPVPSMLSVIARRILEGQPPRRDDQPMRKLTKTPPAPSNQQPNQKKNKRS